MGFAKQALGSSSTVSDVAADANVDLKGKYAIVTGANTGAHNSKSSEATLGSESIRLFFFVCAGIGLVTARALVQMGAHVIVGSWRLTGGNTSATDACKSLPC
jgi:NAD(P)-dependent dehydrogenase (short-subunit alcohol dehydrogenase family)